MIESTSIVTITAELVPGTAIVHRQVLPESRTALMGHAYVTSFVHWICQPEHGGIALAVITSDGQIVGYAIGAPLGYASALSRHLFWISMTSAVLRPWLIFRPQFRRGYRDRLRLVATGSVPERAKLNLPPPTMTLIAFGVLPALRRKQMGRSLLGAFEKRARDMGMRSLRLSMRPDNAAARSLYESCGWYVLAESAEQVYYAKML